MLSIGSTTKQATLAAMATEKKSNAIELSRLFNRLRDDMVIEWPSIIHARQNRKMCG